VLAVALTFDASQFRRDPIPWGYPQEGATIYLDTYSHLRLFNTYDWGGYLDYRFRGDPEIFIDGRADTYPNELIEEYFSMVDGDTGWDTRMNNYDIGVIMIRWNDGLNFPLQDHPDWVAIHSNEYWNTNMYVRRSALEAMRQS
jgi:hypothetical protein